MRELLIFGGNYIHNVQVRRRTEKSLSRRVVKLDPGDDILDIISKMKGCVRYLCM